MVGFMQKLRTECRTGGFLRAARAEYFGTLFLVFCSCSATLGHRHRGTISNEIIPTQDVTLQVALAHGLTAAVLTMALGSVSGAHFNPSITVALWVTRRITWPRALLYTAVQLVGALCGSGMLYGMTARSFYADDNRVPLKIHGSAGNFKEDNDTVSKLDGPSRLGLCLYEVRGVHVSQAFGLEFMCSLLHTIAVCATWGFDRPTVLIRSVAVAASLIVGHIVTTPFTGAALNPVRAFAPSLLLNHWNHHWLFWCAPLLGGIIGAFTFEYCQEQLSEMEILRNSLNNSGGHCSKPRLSRTSHTTEMTFTPSSTYEDLSSCRL